MSDKTLYKVTVRPSEDFPERQFFVQAENHEAAMRYGQESWYADMPLLVTTYELPFAEIEEPSKGTRITTPHHPRGTSKSRVMRSRE